MLEQLVLGLHLFSFHDGSMVQEQYHCQHGNWYADKKARCTTTKTSREPNDFNPGLYVRHAPSGFGAGWVRNNSEGHESFHVDWTHNVWRNLDLTIGAATGYERAEVIPVVAPSLFFKAVENSAYSAGGRIVYLPGIKGARDAIHITTEFKWK